MNKEREWTQDEKLYLAEKNKADQEAYNNRMFCTILMLGGFLLSAALPFVGLAILAGGFFWFRGIKKESEARDERFRQFLIKAGRDPLFYGFKEDGKRAC